MSTLTLIRDLEQQLLNAKKDRDNVIKQTRATQRLGARFVLTTDNNPQLFEEVSSHVKREPYLAAMEAGTIVIYPYYKIKEDRVLYYPSGHDKEFEGVEKSLIESNELLQTLIPTDDKARDIIQDLKKTNTDRELVEDLEIGTNILSVPSNESEVLDDSIQLLHQLNEERDNEITDDEEDNEEEGSRGYANLEEAFSALEEDLSPNP